MHTYFPLYSDTRPRRGPQSGGHLASTITSVAHLHRKHKNGLVSTGNTLRSAVGRLTLIELPNMSYFRSFKSLANFLRKTGSGLGRPPWEVPCRKRLAYWNLPASIPSYDFSGLYIDLTTIYGKRYQVFIAATSHWLHKEIVICGRR